MIQLADKEAESREGRRPRVVMLLANEFVHDTRVFKEARSLVECGCEVIVLAQARADLPCREVQHGITVIRLPDKPRPFIQLGAIFAAWWSRSMLDSAVEPRLPSVGGGGPNRMTRLMTTTRTTAQWVSHVAERAASAVGRLIVPRKRRSMVRKVGRRAWGVGEAGARSVIRAWRRLTGLVRKTTKQGIKRLRPNNGWLPLPIRPLLFNVHLARAARALRADVVHAHDLNTLLAGTLVKRLDGVRLVFDSHELFLERNLAANRRRMDRAIWKPVERACIKHCDLVISVSEGICRHLQSQYKIRKPELIRNVQPYEAPVARHRLLSSELGIAEHVAVVLYPGAITVNRGLEQMIDSAPHLRQAAYVVMGYARNQKYLESLKERARMLGVLGVSVFFRDAVPIDQVVRYTASADLGIVPTQNICLSYYFESSNKIFHCLMAGVPVAMSDHIEKRLVVEEHGVGVLFDERDPLAIAEAVNGALTDRDRYARMQEACLKAALVLNWEQEEARLRALYAPLLGVSVLTPRPALAHANGAGCHDDPVTLEPVMIEVNGCAAHEPAGAP